MISSQATQNGVGKAQGEEGDAAGDAPPEKQPEQRRRDQATGECRCQQRGGGARIGVSGAGGSRASHACMKGKGEEKVDGLDPIFTCDGSPVCLVNMGSRRRVWWWCVWPGARLVYPGGDKIGGTLWATYASLLPAFGFRKVRLR